MSFGVVAYLILGAWLHGADSTVCYEIHYQNYAAGSMRKEFVYERVGETSRPVQRTIYKNGLEEPREAAFLQTSGKWREYGDDNIPDLLRSQLLRFKKAGLKKIEVPELSLILPLESGYAPGDFGAPVIVSRPQPCQH